METSKLYKFTSWPTPEGIEPPKEFWNRFKETRLESEETKFMYPDRRLTLKSRSIRRLNFENDDGIVDV